MSLGRFFVGILRLWFLSFCTKSFSIDGKIQARSRKFYFILYLCDASTTHLSARNAWLFFNMAPKAFNVFCCFHCGIKSFKGRNYVNKIYFLNSSVERLLWFFQRNIFIFLLGMRHMWSRKWVVYFHTKTFSLGNNEKCYSLPYKAVLFFISFQYFKIEIATNHKRFSAIELESKHRPFPLSSN